MEEEVIARVAIEAEPETDKSPVKLVLPETAKVVMLAFLAMNSLEEERLVAEMKLPPLKFCE